MTLTLDPEVAAALAPMMAAMGEPPPPLPVGDVAGRRPPTEAVMKLTAGLQPMPADVARTDFRVPVDGDTQMLARWFAKDGSAPGSAALYLHGGGMVMGSVDLYDGPVARYVASSGVPLLAVDYRLAPEHPYPTGVQDCLAGLRWLAEHAAELGVDPARIAVMGDSGGGGLAAAVAVLARDRGGPAIARQILIYPMLDDRNTAPNSHIGQNAVWTPDDNATAWGAVLAGRTGSDVPSTAAPARLSDATGLPPAYIEVGQLDIFCAEDLAYAALLNQAGVEVEFHLRPGVPHEFETFAFDAEVSRRAMADRDRVLRSV